MGSFKRFNEDKLPDKCEFYSSLKDKCISKEEYDGAINIWNVFKIKTLFEYHDWHLKTDILLLADVFEKFIKTCLDYYGLDPCHYFSAPGLNWDAMLKMIGVKLELISDTDMHLLIEKGMSGGISYISKKYTKANNRYMWNYNSNKESKFIIYWDANSLYGYGMSNPPSNSKFHWVTKKEINKLDFNSVSENSSIGYFLEIDLEYPSKLHDFHNDYPLAPEKLKISSDMLSKYCSDIADKYGIVSKFKR